MGEEQEGVWDKSEHAGLNKTKNVVWLESYFWKHEQKGCSGCTGLLHPVCLCFSLVASFEDMMRCQGFRDRLCVLKEDRASLCWTQYRCQVSRFLFWYGKNIANENFRQAITSNEKAVDLLL